MQTGAEICGHTFVCLSSAPSIIDLTSSASNRVQEHARLTRVLRSLAVETAPDGTDIAAGISALESEKFHRYLSRELLILYAAGSKMLPDSVPEMAQRILTAS